MAYLSLDRVEVRILAVGQGSSNVICGYNGELLTYLLVNDFGGDSGKADPSVIEQSLAELDALMKKRADDERILIEHDKGQLGLINPAAFQFNAFLDAFVLSHPDRDHYLRFARYLNTAMFRDYPTDEHTKNRSVTVPKENGFQESYGFDSQRYSFQQTGELNTEFGIAAVTFEKKFLEDGSYCCSRFAINIIPKSEDGEIDNIGFSLGHSHPPNASASSVTGKIIDYHISHSPKKIRFERTGGKTGAVEFPDAVTFEEFAAEKVFTLIACTVALEEEFGPERQQYYKWLASVWKLAYEYLKVAISCAEVKAALDAAEKEAPNIGMAGIHALYHHCAMYPAKIASIMPLVQHAHQSIDVYDNREIDAPFPLMLSILPLPNFEVGAYLSFAAEGEPLELDRNDIGNPGGNLYSLTMILSLTDPFDTKNIFPGDTTVQGMLFHLIHNAAKIGDAKLLIAPHHGSWETAEGWLCTKDGERQTQVFDMYISIIQPCVHLISAGMHSNHHHPESLYAEEMINIGESLLSAQKHNISVFVQADYGETGPGAFQYEPVEKAIYTTRVPGGYQSYAVLYDSSGLVYFAYAPGNFDTREPLEVEYDSFIPKADSTAALTSHPTAFTFEHRGYALWK